MSWIVGQTCFFQGYEGSLLKVTSKNGKTASPVGFVTFNSRAGADAAKQDLQVRNPTFSHQNLQICNLTDLYSIYDLSHTNQQGASCKSCRTHKAQPRQDIVALLQSAAVQATVKPTETTNFLPPFLPPVSFTWPTFGRKTSRPHLCHVSRLLPPLSKRVEHQHPVSHTSFFCSKEFGSIPTCPRPSGWSLQNLTRRSANPSRWSLHQLCHSLHLCTPSPDVSSTNKPLKK